MKKNVLSFVWLLLSIASIQAAHAATINPDLYMNATAENPYDVTYLLQNPTGENNFGWTRNSQDAAAGYNKHNTEFDSDVYKGVGIESWYWSPVKGAKLIWQEINDILPGHYVITANVVGQVYNDASNKGKCLTGLYLTANNSRTPITTNNWQRLSVECTIQKGETLTIGITADETNGNDWTSISQVTLQCTSPGQPEDIALSEDFDVTCVRGTSYANVMLKRNIPSDKLSTICLPFDVSPSVTQEYFADVWAVSGCTTHGNDVVLEGKRSDCIKTGQTYLVKAKNGNISSYTFNNVLLNAAPPATQILANGWKLCGSYRHVITTTPVWLLQDNDKTCHYTKIPTDIKGFSGYVQKQ